MSEIPPRMQITLTKDNAKAVTKWAEEREIKPSQAVNKVIKKFFFDIENRPQNGVETSDNFEDKLEKISSKIDFLTAAFQGTILDLVESSVLTKDANWVDDSMRENAKKVREDYEEIFEKFSESGVNNG